MRQLFSSLDASRKKKKKTFIETAGVRFDALVTAFTLDGNSLMILWAFFLQQV